MGDQVREANRVSDAAVRAKTGKVWAEWFALLDDAGAAAKDHKGIVTLLAGHEGITPWWQQAVAVAYEQERGLRDKHEMPEGFQISGSKTVGVPVERLFTAWTDPDERARWLPDAPLTGGKATPFKSLRGAWGDRGSRVDVNFTSKASDRAQVALQHSKLRNREEAEQMKAFWRETLGRLKAHLEE